MLSSLRPQPCPPSEFLTHRFAVLQASNRAPPPLSPPALPSSSSGHLSLSPPKNQDDEDEDQASSKIPVPRQKYIPVSKAELLDGVVSSVFGDDDGDDLEQFLLLSSCLDSILHAEHKKITEEMRAGFFYSNSAIEQFTEEEANGEGLDSGIGSEENEAENSTLFDDYVEGLRKLLRSSAKDVKRSMVINFGVQPA